MSETSRGRKRRFFTTPPPDLVLPDDAKERAPQLQTPQRSAVLAVLYFYQEESIYCPLSRVRKVFNIPKSIASDIVRSKRARRLQNSDLPDTRGALRELTNADANAIADYINQAEFEEKGETWLTLTERAGVVPKDQKKEYSTKIIQSRVTAISGIKTCKAAIKEELTENVQIARVRWCIRYLVLRPHRVD